MSTRIRQAFGVILAVLAWSALLVLPAPSGTATTALRYDDLPAGVAEYSTVSSWGRTNLTYAFANGTGDIAGDEERTAVRQAFQIWSGSTPLTFTETSVATADIVISWAAGDHGDGHPFDGTNGVLAHAFYPAHGGDVHFDEAETWTTAERPDSTQPIDLVTVAAHEIGHAIGLGHSDDSSALMYAYYLASHRYLAADDLNGARALYGGQPYYGSRLTAFADVTGDARADAIAVNDNGVVVRRSDGTKFAGNEYWTSIGYYGSIVTAFADVTGDGRADAIAVNAAGITVRPSNGAQFTANQTWTAEPFAGTRMTAFADVTGDGRADAIAVNNSGALLVRRSSGLSFLPAETWSSIAFYGSRLTDFADVTGDGLADAIAVNDNGVTVRRSSGVTFLSNEAWTTNPYYGGRLTDIVDTTGDRMADAVAVNDSGITVRRSTALAFAGNETWSNPYYGSRLTAFADVTGDGRADAIVINEWVIVRRSTGSSFGAYETWT
jgi:hypothetical protein